MSTTPPPPPGGIAWPFRVQLDHGGAVERRLLREYFGLDPALVADAVSDGVFALDRLPERPAEADVPHLLYRAARDRLRAVLRGNRRRRGREAEYHDRRVTRRAERDPTPAEDAAARELAALFRARIALTAAEEAAFDLWMADVTDPADLAARLGCDEAEAVKILARFRQRLKRVRDRLNPED